MPRPKPKLAPGQITVAQAAKLLKMTTSGVYAAIKKKAIEAKRTKAGVIVSRASAKQYRADTLKYFRDADRRKAGKLTDEEFLQQMWDNDPD